MVSGVSAFQILRACLVANPLRARTFYAAATEARCSLLGIRALLGVDGLFHDGLLEALSDRFSLFLRMRRRFLVFELVLQGLCFCRLDHL